MPANLNPETGIAYGLISSNALNSEVVDTLLFGTQAKDHYYEEWLQTEAIDRGWDQEGSPSEFLEELPYEEQPEYDGGPDEKLITGGYEEVDYQTVYIGGALHFWIFKSPVITECGREGSICVPNACILDTLDGDYSGYDVPKEWRNDET